ncbi:hypothetical protein VKT23_020001 [Stygiomarasmius scandens]|uniref:Uncharacterized protein n=1 Tax=Marasmiellus scandens TaxID=2682957 RepID=A0ABR1IP85_9AGAR
MTPSTQTLKNIQPGASSSPAPSGADTNTRQKGTTSSSKTSKPANSSKGKSKPTTGKKRGNPGKFHGIYLEELEKELPGFYERWFKRFRWHTVGCPAEFLKVEPIQKPQPDNPGAVEEATTASSGLSVTEFEALVKECNKRRDELIAQAKKQLAAWFYRQSQRAKQPIAGAGIFSGLIKKLCRVQHAPRRPIPYKFYMQHPDFAEKCSSHRLHFQCKVAEELFNEEDTETQERITQEAEEEHEVNFEAYKELMEGDNIALDGIATFGELSKEICRQNFSKFMLPQLELLRKVTGMSIVLIAGKPPAPGGAVDDFDLITLSAGTTVGPDPKRFEEFNRNDFTKHVIGQFMLFLLKTVEDVNADAGSLNDSAVARVTDKATQPAAELGSLLDDAALIQMPDDDDEEDFEDEQKKGRGKRNETTKAVVKKRKPQPKTKNVSREFVDESSDEDPWPDSDADSTNNTTATVHVTETTQAKPRLRPCPREKTPVLPEGYVLHPETKAYLDELHDDERRKTLREIRGHSRADFEQSNNIYKHKQLMKELEKDLDKRMDSGYRNPNILAILGLPVPSASAGPLLATIAPEVASGSGNSNPAPSSPSHSGPISPGCSTPSPPLHLGHSTAAETDFALVRKSPALENPAPASIPPTVTSQGAHYILCNIYCNNICGKRDG